MMGDELIVEEFGLPDSKDMIKDNGSNDDDLQIEFNKDLMDGEGDLVNNGDRQDT